MKKTMHKLDNVAADEANLEAKIEKRKASLDEISIFSFFVANKHF